MFVYKGEGVNVWFVNKFKGELGYVHFMRKLVIICFMTILSVFVLLDYNYFVTDGLVGEINYDKIVFSNNSGYSAQDISIDDMVDMQEQQVSLTIVLEYSQEAVDMVPNSVQSVYEKDNSFRDEHFEYYKEYHTRKNNELITTINLTDYEYRYVSPLTPFIIYTYSVWHFDRLKNTIYQELATNPNIAKAYVEYYNGSPFTSTMYGAAGMAGALGVVNNRTFTGDGIKVGILEPGVIDEDHSNFEGISITKHSQLLQIQNKAKHTTSVASVIGGINGIAPDVTFLSSQIKGDSIADEVDWLMEQGADIVNMSFGDAVPNGVYGAGSAYTDYATRVYNRIFVISAGNLVGTSNYYVGNPGLAYNGLTVGSMASDRTRASTSSYLTVDGAIKPTIMAKGESIMIPGYAGEVFSGTSYSAPVVTGLLALLMEEYPGLKRKPMKLISLICANAKRTSSAYYYDLDNNFDEEMGAGEFNYTNIRSNYSNFMEIPLANGDSSNIVYTKQFMLNEGQTLRAAITWLSYNYKEDTNDQKTDYDIRILSNNIEYSRGSTIYNNVEMVDFTATSDNTGCTVIISQHSTLAMSAETVNFAYSIHN